MTPIATTRWCSYCKRDISGTPRSCPHCGVVFSREHAATTEDYAAARRWRRRQALWRLWYRLQTPLTVAGIATPGITALASGAIAYWWSLHPSLIFAPVLGVVSYIRIFIFTDSKFPLWVHPIGYCACLVFYGYIGAFLLGFFIVGPNNGIGLTGLFAPTAFSVTAYVLVSLAGALLTYETPLAAIVDSIRSELRDQERTKREKR